MPLNAQLINELTRVVGETHVLTAPADLHVYSFDSALDRALPSAVVLPGNASETAAVVSLLSRHKIPFVTRGAGTSLCGGPVPLSGAVVIGLARLNRIGPLEKANAVVRVEPGVVNQRLQQWLEPQGLFYPPDPGSQKACTIGGNVGTNAGGPHCLKYGVTSQFVESLEVVLPDGAFLPLRADDPGFDVLGLFVGSEGTLGVATGIRLRLLPIPKFIRTMVVSFPSIEDAIQSVTDIIAEGILPATLEAMDKTIVQAVEAFSHAGYPTEAEAVLLIEVDGDAGAELDGQVEKIRAVCERNKSFDFRFAADEAERRRLWEGRRGSYAAMARLAPNVLVEDGAVPRTRLPEALRRVKAIADEAGVQVALLFHAGDGNLHPQILFDERDAEQTRVVKEAGYRMLKACVDLGGTISGEHGIGIDKREAMKWLFDRETLALFRRLKNEIDPKNLCNPDKLIPLVSRPPVVAAPDGREDGPPQVASKVSRPESEKDLVALVRRYAGQRKAFGVEGTGSRFFCIENTVIQTSGLNAILEHDKGNLSLTVQCGVPVEEARAAVEKDGQYLWIPGKGTVGGAVATNAPLEPRIRDLVLGMRVLLPAGEIVRFGAKTMKNVAGYDAAKLLIGSWGLLGVILDVTFRLFPYPAARSAVRPDYAPFIMKPIHRKIRAAFDPLEILSPRTAMLTAEDLKALPKERDRRPARDLDLEGLNEKFWM